MTPVPTRLDAATDLLATRWGLRLLRWAVIVLMACALAACVATGANRPADPRLEGQSRVPGFGEVAFRVIPSPGSGMNAGQYCGLLAETEAQVQRGLMGRRDLAGYDGMVFRFSGDSSSSFYMLNVPVPLTVAWFDAKGRFVSSADMEPCVDREDCPLYPPARPYRLALEVMSGGLGRLGVGPGSVMEVGGACKPR
ncbi:MAG: DUF192 domain-containing protein [Actinomycetota bacterium]|nr:DUF192 domain-containing protein [Actinomycetota bacterium]